MRMRKIIPLIPFALLMWLPAEVIPAEKVYIDLSAPSVRRLPVAIDDFRESGGGKDKAQTELSQTVKSELKDALSGDLAFSNLFTIVENPPYPERPAAFDKESGGAAGVEWPLWRSAGADVLIKGSYRIEGEKLTVEVRMFDVVREKEILGKRYVGGAASRRRLVHYFADEIYMELTGRKGIFTTKMLFVTDRTGNKEIYLSDYDGKNARAVTRNGSINLSPQWAPDGKRVLYTSYKKGTPALYMLDLETGKDETVSARKGINIGGRFSPDGGSVALTLSTNKSPELHLLDLGKRELKRLTDNYAIDVSPTFSPDGKRMAFVSDMNGNPHIFVLDFYANSLKRLTFDGRYNSSPAWSPDGKKIAFSRSGEDGRFDIWVMESNGANPARLTSEGNNRNPSWSPDGRHIAFSSSSRGSSSLYIMDTEGGVLRKLETGPGNSKTPSWSPFLD